MQNDEKLHETLSRAIEKLQDMHDGPDTKKFVFFNADKSIMKKAKRFARKNGFRIVKPRR
jgi:hypothetical protein